MTPDDCEAFRQPHSRTPGHPERGVAPTVEVTTGPLGQASPTASAWRSPNGSCAAIMAPDLVDPARGSFAGEDASKRGQSRGASLGGSLARPLDDLLPTNNHITIDGATEMAFHDATPRARFAALRLARDKRG